MKINFKTAILSLIISINAYAQEISIELPVLSPQSPTTNDLGKYGEVQVNESTGIISPSIPLFEYYAGTISIPIVLNYSGNGVRVNQDPTWAGINWNINPGGVITRVVKDEADELTPLSNRLYYSEANLENLPGVREVNPNTCYLNTSTIWFNTLKHMSFENVDTKVDVFNYNFLGYSGSFYLDIDNNVHLIKYDKELSISFTLMPNNKSMFTIKTPDGNTYFFGGQNASESSRTYANIGAGSTVNAPFTQNAFYLKTISFLNGGLVDYEYETILENADYDYEVGIQESAAKTYDGTVPCNKKITHILGKIERLVRLKKITCSFNNQSIEFDSEIRGRLIKLNNIYLKNGTTLLKKVHLNYYMLNNEQSVNENKFFLTKVDFYNKNNEFEYDYELDYTSLASFPSKNSFAQDHLGFYNGKNANTTLLPITNYTILNENCFFGLANREADFGYSKFGTLSQIKYPTGGYTRFEYELPYEGEKIVIQQHYMTAYFRDENRDFESSTYTQNGIYHSYSSTYHPNQGDAPLVVTATTQMTAQVNITTKAPFSHQSNVTLSVLKKTNLGFRVVETAVKNFPNTQNTIENYINNYTFTLQPGSYIFKLAVNLNNADNNNIHSVIAIAQLGLPSETTSIYHPGLRIKRVKTYDNNGSSNITRYYYNNRFQLNQESNTFSPNYVFKTLINDPDDSTYPLLTLYNLSTNSVKNIYNTDDGSNVYDTVTVSYGGDDFENGGKQLTFYKYSNYSPINYNTQPCNSIVPFQLDESEIVNYVDIGDNDSYQNSVLIEELFFKKESSIFKTLKKSNYTYEGITETAANNIKLFNYAPTSSPTLGGNFYFLYKTKSFKYRLMSTKTKEYVGTNLTDEISNIVTHTYTADKVSLPSTIEVIDSSGETNKTKVYYPSDALSISNLSYTDMGLLNTLQTGKHNIAEVVKIENYKNNVLLQSKQKSYQNWLGNILPKTISSSKGADTTEERIEFFNYDFYGKPLLVSQKEGTKIGYRYNNRGQVILKIENPPTEFEEGEINNSELCYYQNLYSKSMVTKYDYDPVTNNLIKITDPKCDVITYHYDDFGRLEFVKDAQNNILSENKYNYKN